MNEKELRQKIADEIRQDLRNAMENCACLGRDAYGNYIDNMVDEITKKITSK